MTKELRVLIAYESDEFRKFLRMNVANRYQTIDLDFINNSSSFLWEIDKRDSDLAISDVVVPDMYGLDILRKIRNEGNDVPLYLFTISDTFRREAMECGATGVLEKDPHRGEFEYHINDSRVVQVIGLLDKYLAAKRGSVNGNGIADG